MDMTEKEQWEEETRIALEETRTISQWKNENEENDQLLAENTELKTRLKVAESIVVHHQEMLHDIADWLSVIPHEIERVAMQKEIRDIPKIE